MPRNDRQRKPGILEQVERIERGLPGIPKYGILAQADRIMRGLPGIPRNRGILAQIQGATEPDSFEWFSLIPDDKAITTVNMPPWLRGRARRSRAPELLLVRRARDKHWKLEGAMATAQSRAATLEGLAWAITGDENNCKLLDFKRGPKTLRRGDSVNIMRLLKKAAGEVPSPSPVKPRAKPISKLHALKGMPEIPEMFEGDRRSKRVLWLSRIAAYAQKAKRDSGHRVFVSVQLAQGALETGWGHTESFKTGHSFLGVKGRGDAGSGTYATTEVVDGKEVPIRDKFAHYSSVYEACRAQGMLISTAKRYEKAANAKTPEEQIRHIRYGGYATAPPEEYIRAIIRIMEGYDLKKYDLP